MIECAKFCRTSTSTESSSLKLHRKAMSTSISTRFSNSVLFNPVTARFLKSLQSSNPFVFLAIPKVILLSAHYDRENKLQKPIFSSSSPSSSLQPIEELLPKLQEIVKLFQGVEEPKAKYEQLLFYGRNLNPLGSQYKTSENKVQGCVSQVWVRAYLDSGKNVIFEADSDSVLTKGLAALLVQALSGRPVDEIVRVSPDFVALLGLKQSLTPSRNNAQVDAEKGLAIVYCS